MNPGGVLSEMNLPAIDIVSSNLKFLLSKWYLLSQGSLVIFYQISCDTLTLREQNHPSFLSM